MNSLSAAEIVLTDAGAPMHCAEITRQIVERELWNTDGKTPAQTISSQLGRDIKEKGPASRFLRTGRGMFSINPSRTSKPDGADALPPEMSGNSRGANTEQDSSPPPR
ncbi:MAG: winged helix-turn-helix domain-containing protein [Thermomicrobiales bacterium]